jgi:hypothetical protein
VGKRRAAQSCACRHTPCRRLCICAPRGSGGAEPKPTESRPARVATRRARRAPLPLERSPAACGFHWRSRCSWLDPAARGSIPLFVARSRCSWLSLAIKFPRCSDRIVAPLPRSFLLSRSLLKLEQGSLIAPAVLGNHVTPRAASLTSTAAPRSEASLHQTRVANARRAAAPLIHGALSWHRRVTRAERTPSLGEGVWGNPAQKRKPSPGTQQRQEEEEDMQQRQPPPQPPCVLSARFPARCTRARCTQPRRGRWRRHFSNTKAKKKNERGAVEGRKGWNGFRKGQPQAAGPARGTPQPTPARHTPHASRLRDTAPVPRDTSH